MFGGSHRNGGRQRMKTTRKRPEHHLNCKEDLRGPIMLESCGWVSVCLSGPASGALVVGRPHFSLAQGTAKERNIWKSIMLNSAALETAHGVDGNIKKTIVDNKGGVKKGG
ncbi:hypothetical protein E2C01_023936 [Portunus trituberculatus]|uniref:Uncharacterized protein n=1 Tax=Portunus trituberculatus TaxID=210409 RepID=A0A5B7EAL4_PORTR|nr:hypothetical protein [Portunus trituberculatus]